MSTIYTEPRQCPATIAIRDDRWGAVRDRCELAIGHGGLHQVRRDACEPPAWLVWEG